MRSQRRVDPVSRTGTRLVRRSDRSREDRFERHQHVERAGGQEVESATERSAQRQPALIGLRLPLEDRHRDVAAHRVAGDVGLRRLPVFRHELAPQRFRLFDPFLHRPPLLAVVGCREREAAREEDLTKCLVLRRRVLWRFAALRRVAVGVEDQALVPLDGDLDVVGGAGDDADVDGVGCGRLASQHLVQEGRHDRNSSRQRHAGPGNHSCLLDAGIMA